MDKPWKELVKLAVLETEIPGQDEEGETIAASPRFRRGRRRGRQQSPIPSPQEIMSMDNETPALRFALLLANKYIHNDQWSEEEHNPLETEIRNLSLNQGVPPVWQDMANFYCFLNTFYFFRIKRKIFSIEPRFIGNGHRPVQCPVLSQVFQIHSR